MKDQELTYHVMLTRISDGEKINTIREVRWILQCSLKEAKDLVEIVEEGRVAQLYSCNSGSTEGLNTIIENLRRCNTGIEVFCDTNLVESYGPIFTVHCVIPNSKDQVSYSFDTYEEAIRCVPDIVKENKMMLYPYHLYIKEHRSDDEVVLRSIMALLPFKSKPGVPPHISKAMGQRIRETNNV